MQFAGKEQTRN